MICLNCSNSGEKTDKNLFRKNGKIVLRGKRVFQKYQCKKCYAIIKGEQIQ